MENQKETVIITGSSGLIGSAVAERLAPHYDVVGFDVKEPSRETAADFVQVDITSDESVRQALGQVRERYGDQIASVVHLAAYYDFSGDPSPKYEEITVRGTERLLRLLQDVGAQQFIFSSTMIVHRPTEPGRPISEEDPLGGKWAYPQSKIETEQIIREQHGDIPVVLMRVAGVYTDACDSIPIANQMQRIYEKRLTSHVYPGDPSHGQAFVHLEDLVEALWQTVKRRAELPEEVPLLIGEPETYSYDRLQRELGRLIRGETEWTTEQVPKAVAKTGTWVQDKIPGIDPPFVKPSMIDMADDHYELDVSRAHALLDWQPRHRLIDTLPRMVKALKTDPARWYERHDLEPPEDKQD